MAAPSDDRNGVVVNRARSGVHAIDSTTGIPNCLVEERCSEKRVRKFMRKVSALPRSATSTLVGPKSGFLQPYSATSSQYILGQKINFYVIKEAMVRSASRIGSTVNSQYAKAN